MIDLKKLLTFQVPASEAEQAAQIAKLTAERDHWRDDSQDLSDRRGEFVEQLYALEARATAAEAAVVKLTATIEMTRLARQADKELLEQADYDLEQSKVRESALRFAASNFFAMVEGESPSLLENDCNAEALRAALAQSSAGEKPC